MIYLDGFSGYGGFHFGLEEAGFKFDKVYFSEIDKHAIANYSYNYPNSIYAGAIQSVSRRTIEHIDLFTFGWPCQDNSIAGKRKGQQSGTRSGLLYEAVRVIDEFKPRNFIAENVKGLLSVNAGIDIVESLKLLSILNDNCPQYDIEMQLLNTRWVLPQNRERLFFVGHLRGTGSRKIFPIGEISEWNNERSTETAVIRTLTAGGNSGGHHSGMTIVSMRGRNIENGKRNDYKGAPTIQRLEFNNDWISNCLTSVQKDNLVFKSNYLSWSKQDSHYARAHFTDGNVGALNSSNEPKIIEKHLIRRLTPIECERLQGLPDNWTKYGIYNNQVKEISDSQRYKLIGNGVTTKIIKLIGSKLITNATPYITPCK